MLVKILSAVIMISHTVQKSFISFIRQDCCRLGRFCHLSHNFCFINVYQRPWNEAGLVVFGNEQLKAVRVYTIPNKTFLPRQSTA